VGVTATKRRVAAAARAARSDREETERVLQQAEPVGLDYEEPEFSRNSIPPAELDREYAVKSPEEVLLDIQRAIDGLYMISRSGFLGGG
jgi:hypothetical protein